MLTLTHDITIGPMDRSFRLRRVLSVQIHKDIHALGDQATLTLSALHENQSLQLQDQVPLGSPIHIAIGYDGDNKNEFEGYVMQIENKKQKLVLHCSDAIYLYQQDVPAQTYAATEGPHELQKILRDLAEDVQLTDVELAPELQAFTYKTFQRSAGPAVQTLKKIKEDLSILIYMRQKTLFASGPHSSDMQIDGRNVRYRLDRNILESKLTYRSTGERQLRVRVKSRDQADEPLEVIASGHPDQPDFQVKSAGSESKAAAPSPNNEKKTETIELLRYHIQDIDTLKKIAEKELSKWNYDGYEGHINTWLQPYCSYGYHALLQDPEHSDRSATFFIEKVEVSFSDQGGTRKIYLGKRILSS